VNEGIKALEKHDNTGCGEAEPGSPGLELGLVREVVS